MRVEHKLTIRISDDDRGLAGEFSRSESLPPDVTGRYDACVSGVILLGADQQPQLLPLPGIGIAAGIYVEGDGPVVVKLTDSEALGDGDATLTLAGAEAGQSAKLFLTGRFTGLSAWAADAGRAVRLRYVVWGASPLPSP